jgi:hypothetical protein
MNKKESIGGAVVLGISGVLFLIFFVLKLVDAIDWSWGWVVSPLWISIGLLLVLAIPAAFIIARQESEIEEQSLKLFKSLKEDSKEKDEE